jgi:Cft2 family RNA processing exonuclease
MSWLVQEKNGIHLPQIGWRLDAHKPAEHAFVSHAHFDHMARHGEILCTARTGRLFRARLPGKRTMHQLPFGQTEALTPDCAVTLLPAGHMPGSAMCLLQHAEHGRLLYTGDFKLQASFTSELCTPQPADVLVMETTFGRPQYQFPARERVMADIADWCRQTLADGATPVLLGYSLGKAQELLAGLAGTGLPIMLHDEVHRLTRVCSSFGLEFPQHEEFDARTVSGHVVIAPPQPRDSGFLRKIPGARTALASGWALDKSTLYRCGCDTAFPLSDHAGFDELLRLVELVRPRCVYTVHGFAKDFAATLRERGVEAWALGLENQLDLGLGLANRAS